LAESSFLIFFVARPSISQLDIEHGSPLGGKSSRPRDRAEEPGSVPGSKRKGGLAMGAVIAVLFVSIVIASERLTRRLH
jgi:hypothetical protein